MKLNRERVQKGIFFSVGISILAIILLILYYQNSFTLAVFTRIRSEFLLIALLITLTFWSIKALKLQVMARILGSGVSFKRIFSIFLASAFVSHITPSSSGGVPFIIYFLHREGLSLGESTVLTVLENMLTLILFVLLAPFLLFIWGDSLNLSPGISRFFYLALFLLTVLIMLYIILIFNSHLASRFINWITGFNWIKALVGEERLEYFRQLIIEEIYLFKKGLELILDKKRNFIFIVVSTLIYWGVYLSLAPVLLKGLGVNVAVPPVILAQIIFNFIQPLIPTPGGSGGAELGFAYLFKFLIPNYFLGIFVALWRFFMFYFSLIIGGIYFINLIKGTGYLEQ